MKAQSLSPSEILLFCVALLGFAVISYRHGGDSTVTAVRSGFPAAEERAEPLPALAIHFTLVPRTSRLSREAGADEAAFRREQEPARPGEQ